MIEKILQDQRKMKVTALERGIIHIKCGGLDGYQESLLNRYGFIKELEKEKECVESENTVSNNSGGTLQIGDELELKFSKNGTELFKTLPESKINTGATIHSNKGFELKLSLRDDEKIVGLGDHQRQSFLLNGKSDTLWVTYPVKHVPVPFFMSNKGYGIFINTTSKLAYDIGCLHKNQSIFSVSDGYLDVYIITGDSFAEMVDKYTEITGKPELAPIKSFGLWLLMHTVANGHDVIDVARTLRKEGIPCDNISLEPDWMENRYDYSTEKEWNSSRFRGVPDGTFRRGPDRMIHALNRMGYELGLWLCCRHDLSWEEERQLGDKGNIIEAGGGELKLDGIEVGHPDDNVGHAPIWMDEFTKRDEAWFEHLKKFVDDGIRFFKVDPAVLINEFPDRLYANGKRDDEMHNIAFMLCSKQMFKDYETFTGRRPYGISVAGWAGFQGFSGTWAGDTGGGGQSLVGILQNSVMGHSYSTCDMETLKVSGIHMGFMLPWALINSWASFNYPGYQGDFIDSVYRDYSRFRMTLLPYFYSLAYEATQSAKAIARPMFMEFENADESYEITTQFMLGASILTTIYTEDKITLPEGKWYDFWNDTIVDGDWTEQSISYAENRGGHVMLREGAIIPTIEPMQHTTEKEIEEITWLLFPGSEASSFTLYLDDGDSLEYRNGSYAAATITVTPQGDKLRIEWSDVSGSDKERFTRVKHNYKVLGSNLEVSI